MSNGKEKVKPVVVSLKKQTTQVKAIMSMGMFADESAGEAALEVLKAKKSRQESYERMMEIAGENMSTGARELRRIANNVLCGANIDLC